jgi:oxygen-dependent protoporphyrinogen oxidase
MIRAMATRLADPGPLHDADLVVVGAGVTGLAVARALLRARPDLRVLVLESKQSAGGNIRTEREDGFLIDAGPDSFIRTKPHALALCRDLGLESEFIGTEDVARHVYVAHAGRLELLPGGMALAIPTRLDPLVKTPLLTFRGKLRMLAEPLVSRRTAPTDESILSFFARRVGEEGAEKLAGPLLSGIYAGDVSKLSIRATFPQLVALEKKHGSLVRGLLAEELAREGKSGRARPSMRDVLAWLRREGEARAASPFVSFRGGMGTLVDALVRSLPDGTLRLGTEVRALSRRDDGVYHVEVDGGAVRARAVVLATPAHVAAGLAPDAALARELGEIPYVSTATVFFALDRARVAHSLEGFGFIVPRGEARVLAATWVSSKWRGRAPAGASLIRAFVGGARDPELVESSSDEELVALAKLDLERLMGPLGAPRFTRVYRYARSSPQPVVGHVERLERIRARLSALPGLYVTGAAYDGVGIPDCVRQAEETAKAALEGPLRDAPGQGAPLRATAQPRH